MGKSTRLNLGPCSSSASCTETINGSHEFRITGYSLAKGMGIGKYIPSDTFVVGGFTWAVYFYPDGKSLEDNASYVSLFIALASDGSDVRALFELTLVDQSGNGKDKLHSHFGRNLESGPYTLKYRGSMWGYKRFMKRSQLEASDYLKDDTLLIRCCVGIVRSRTEGPKIYSIPVPPPNIGEQFGRLLDSGERADVKFEVDGEVFAAHKLVLAARSPVFRAQLFGPMKDQTELIKVEDIEATVFKASKAHSWTCMDIYVFATPYRVTWDYYFVSREHTLEIKEWESRQEYEYVKNRGVSIFLMQAGMLGTLQALWDVFPLFTNTGWGENSNLAFLKKHMGATFEKRPQPWVTNVTVDAIQSGDFLAISKIRGRWGGFETLEKWVSGAYAGHSAVCLRDSDGNLWVGESGHENDEGEDIVDVLPWDEWWEFELNKDDSNPHIALLPLHPDVRAKFNETAAWEYALSMKGKPYGYHNMIFSWIDTLEGNYPPPLDAHLVASVMTIWNQIQPAYAANMWNEALNKRMGTQNLTLPEILVEVEKRESSFGELLTIPERDDWLYADGKSTSCVAFILEMYKEAGLFDPIAESIQVTEFTIKDAYNLRFFETDSRRLPKWCNDGDTIKLPYCQIKGKYRMELPGYNTMDPYPHMNEQCPSLPPKYHRPQNC